MSRRCASGFAAGVDGLIVACASAQAVVVAAAAAPVARPAEGRCSASARWRKLECCRDPACGHRAFLSTPVARCEATPRAPATRVHTVGGCNASGGNGVAIAAATAGVARCSNSSSGSTHGGLEEGRHFAVFKRLSNVEELDASRKGEEAAFASSPASLSEVLAVVIGEPLRPESNAEGVTPLNRPNVVLLGEVHDDGVTHKLQLQVLRHCVEACRRQGRRLVLSLEMFETDVQPVLDEYVVHKAIREADMLQDCRPWGNYKDDYRPLVELCRDEGIRVVAANTPRRYVSLVAREGSAALEGLVGNHLSGRSSEACLTRPFRLPWLPLPPASPAYRRKFIEAIASKMPAPPPSNEGSGAGCPFVGFRSEDVRQARPEMMEAQLLWDHSMAMSIAQALRREEGEAQDPLVLHVCGAFHCAHGLGIPEVLPLYVDGETNALDAGQSKAAVSESPELQQWPWLPIDDVTPGCKVGVPSCDNDVAIETTVAAVEYDGPKMSPPGVVSVVCWPGCVAGTTEAVQGGALLPSLGAMGEFVIVTEETWGEGGPPASE